jgi:hypothetical protein
MASFAGATTTKGKMFKYVTGPRGLFDAFREGMVPADQWWEDSLNYALSFNVREGLLADLLSIIPWIGLAQTVYGLFDDFIKVNYHFNEGYEYLVDKVADFQVYVNDMYDVLTETIGSNDPWSITSVGGNQDTDRQYFDPEASKDLVNYVIDVIEEVIKFFGENYNKYVAEPIHDWVDNWNTLFSRPGQDFNYQFERIREIIDIPETETTTSDRPAGGFEYPTGGIGKVIIQPITPSPPTSSPIFSWFHHLV